MFPKLAQFRTPQALRERLAELGCELPVDPEPLSRKQGSPLAAPLTFGPLRAANRWCVQPMEGWDAREGRPSEHTHRRWRRFGLSGAKLIWGGEAVAVRPEARAHERQLIASDGTLGDLAALRESLLDGHRQRVGSAEGLVVGLQLTHSGRYAVGDGGPPRRAFEHPQLDEPATPGPLWTDDQLRRLVDDYSAAAGLAARAGFDFVDLKACHGYLLHELLSAHTRPGPYGGELVNRARLLFEIIERLRAEHPELLIGVRLSAFDTAPVTRPGLGAAERLPAPPVPYRHGFGVDARDPRGIDLSEALELARELATRGVTALNVSGGCPYTNPHVLRPAAFPPSDGYPPPEDPLVGVARHVQATRALTRAAPRLVIVGSGYSYLQQFVPHVAQAVLRDGWADGIGLGRMVLAYPELPADVLEGRPLDRKRLCRTLSDCTTAPRAGLLSGCFPLDDYYRRLPEAQRLREAKHRGSEV